MAHTQPSPTGAVTPHHAHIAAHAQVNGHIPLQSQGQKAPPLSTAQKIAALNEQVWLQIGMCLPPPGPCKIFDDVYRVWLTVLR